MYCARAGLRPARGDLDVSRSLSQRVIETTSPRSSRPTSAQVENRDSGETARSNPRGGGKMNYLNSVTLGNTG